MTNHLRLPPETIARLQKLATSKNQNVTSLLNDFLAREIAAGSIDGEIPGMKITREGNHTRIEIDLDHGSRTVGMELDEAKKLADNLRAALTPGKIKLPPIAYIPGYEEFRETMTELQNDTISGVNAIAEDFLSVSRRGTGIRLFGNSGAVDKTFAPSTAAEIADQIDKVVK